MSENDPAIAVVTLYQINDPSASDLFAHEAAHALFKLLDEYECYFNDQEFRSGFNVATAEERRAGTFLWAGECGKPCPVRCNDPDDPCPAGGVSADGPRCCNDEPTNMTSGSLGLIEGAFYHRCGYYRAQKRCRMRTSSAEFCRACQLAVGALKRDQSLGPCISTDQTAPVN